MRRVPAGVRFAFLLGVGAPLPLGAQAATAPARAVVVPAPGGAVVSADPRQHAIAYEQWHFAPARVAGPWIFVSGVVAGARGATLDGPGFEAAVRRAFSQLEATLAAAGGSLRDVVDLTTYHVFASPAFAGSKQAHLDAFRRVKDEFLPAPYPAWTGVGVAELFPEGGLVEIRAVARRRTGAEGADTAAAARTAGPEGAAAPHAASLRFRASEPRAADFADQRELPPTFGRGEFTLELWIRPDTTFSVGPTARGTVGQLLHWSDADPRPGTPGWWLAGNWLLDGFSRPDGFGPRDTRAGSFGLQLYGGGRVRWTFADAEVMPADSVLGVQAWPAATAPSLLDGRWHHVACVRRWNATTGGATLELWVDGVRTATTETPRRTDMRRWWDRPPHPRSPASLGGWSWGSEVMTAWGTYFTQYEDYKGLVDELRFWDRARTPEELRDRWRDAVGGREPGLVGWFPFDEGRGDDARDRLAPTRVLRLHGGAPDGAGRGWSAEHAPLTRRPGS
jgi:enamine deaminase RidA (YjgF/YER057c/UK114 family)